MLLKLIQAILFFCFISLLSVYEQLNSYNLNIICKYMATTIIQVVAYRLQKTLCIKHYYVFATRNCKTETNI